MISVLLIVMITSRLTRTGLEEEWCFIRMIDATEGFENGKMLLKSICPVLVVHPIDFMFLQQLSKYVDKSAFERNARNCFSTLLERHFLRPTHQGKGPLASALTTLAMRTITITIAITITITIAIAIAIIITNAITITVTITDMKE